MGYTSIVLFVLSALVCINEASEVAFAYNGARKHNDQPFLGFLNQVVKRNAFIFQDYGVFLCQSPGIYQFSFTIHSSSRRDAHVVLKKGYPGQILAEARAKAGGQSSTHTVLNQVRTGEIIYLEVIKDVDQNARSPALNSFSGFLVYPDLFAFSPDVKPQGAKPAPPVGKLPSFLQNKAPNFSI